MFDSGRLWHAMRKTFTKNLKAMQERRNSRTKSRVDHVQVYVKLLGLEVLAWTLLARTSIEDPISSIRFSS